MTGEHQHKIDTLVVCEKQLGEMLAQFEPIYSKYHYTTDRELVELNSKLTKQIKSL